MNSERPPPGEPEEKEKERERRRLERILPEIIKRLVETGYEKISEGPENVRQFVSEMRLPKEALALMLAQIDETKNGLYRVVAKEIRDFLEQTNVAEELTKVLTTLSFEIKTEVRFVPNESRTGVPRPDVRSRVSVKKDRPGGRRGSQPPPPPDPDAEHTPREPDEVPAPRKSQPPPAAGGGHTPSATRSTYQGRYAPETEQDEEHWGEEEPE